MKELYVQKGLTQKEIAEQIGVSQPCISRWMKQFGITTRCPDPWSPEEEQMLKESYRTLSKQEICTRLPDRSWNAIKLKAMDLGVAKSAEHRNSDETIEQLRTLSRANRVKVNFSRTTQIGYVLGVIDGDGFHNNTTTIGLEVVSASFADKFCEALNSIGLNPDRGTRQKKETV